MVSSRRAASKSTPCTYHGALIPKAASKSASSAEFVGGFALPIWSFDRCSAQVQAYPPSLPVGKPTCLSLAHKLACPQVRSTRWVSRVRTLVYLPVFPASRNLYSLRQVASRES